MNTPIIEDKKSSKDMSRVERINLKLEKIKDYSEHKNATTELKEMIKTAVDKLSIIINGVN
jgi:hypothetical protein